MTDVNAIRRLKLLEHGSRGVSKQVRAAILDVEDDDAIIPTAPQEPLAAQG